MLCSDISNHPKSLFFFRNRSKRPVQELSGGQAGRAPSGTPHHWGKGGRRDLVGGREGRQEDRDLRAAPPTESLRLRQKGSHSPISTAQPAARGGGSVVTPAPSRRLRPRPPCEPRARGCPPSREGRTKCLGGWEGHSHRRPRPSGHQARALPLASQSAQYLLSSSLSSLDRMSWCCSFSF